MLKNNYGKMDFEKTSKTISENAKETSYNIFTHSLESRNSNLSESINTYFQHDYIVDTNFFSRELNTFECLSFFIRWHQNIRSTKNKNDTIF